MPSENTLRTLKDLDFDDIQGSSGIIYKSLLKQEAIRWIREDNKLLGDATISPIQRLKIMAGNWRDRLNITVEDLHETK